jgi:putative endonuclease
MPCASSSTDRARQPWACPGRLVYFEHYEDIKAAIQREPNMKHWSRKWKVRLVLKSNPAWNDLYDTLV